MDTKQIYIAGVDEVGRGPLAGPVVTAAVILDPSKPIQGLTDSKKLTAKKREALAAEICDKALAFAYGRAEVEEIDDINILQASLLAMQRAIEVLSPQPTEVLVDGIHCPKISIPNRGIINGDGTIPEISAASIIAKVLRDQEMVELDAEFPDYGFAQHKGYGTAKHMVALKTVGPCRLHRKSFAPVTRLLDVST